MVLPVPNPGNGTVPPFCQRKERIDDPQAGNKRLLEGKALVYRPWKPDRPALQHAYLLLMPITQHDGSQDILDGILSRLDNFTDHCALDVHRNQNPVLDPAGLLDCTKDLSSVTVAPVSIKGVSSNAFGG